MGYARAQIGCQGWNYNDWVTRPGGEFVFYPQGTRPAEMLETYTRAFETVEVDSTFYAVPTASTVEGWTRRASEGFTFSLKLPQEITHKHALGRGSEPLLAEFCERARLLGEHLATILIQLPPQFEATRDNYDALAWFLPLLPRDLRFAVEFRERSWMDEGVTRLLSDHSVALALVEGQWINRTLLWRQARLQEGVDFAYVRWMGDRDLSRFDRVVRPQNENLEGWGRAIAKLEEHRSHVWAYFSNYYEGFAPESANKLKRLIGQPVIDAAMLDDQPSLF